MITFINEHNIFYHQKIKKRVKEDLYIPRQQLITFALHSPGVKVPPQSADSPQSEVDFSESNGIIYASNCEIPPSFKGGIGALFSFLENNVSVTKTDIRIYGNNVVTVLYQLMILDDGKIYGGGIKESCIQNYGLDIQAALLEKEILRQICRAGDWEPGRMNGDNIGMNIYLPVKFSLDNNKIVVYPSKYMYLFKHRRN